MRNLESAEGSLKVHAFQQGDSHTLCGRTLNDSMMKPTGMEWFTPEELATVGDRPCGHCRRLASEE